MLSLIYCFLIILFILFNKQESKSQSNSTSTVTSSKASGSSTSNGGLNHSRSDTDLSRQNTSVDSLEDSSQDLVDLDCSTASAPPSFSSSTSPANGASSGTEPAASQSAQTSNDLVSLGEEAASKTNNQVSYHWLCFILHLMLITFSCYY